VPAAVFGHLKEKEERDKKRKMRERERERKEGEGQPTSASQSNRLSSMLDGGKRRELVYSYGNIFNMCVGYWTAKKLVVC